VGTGLGDRFGVLGARSGRIRAAVLKQRNPLWCRKSRMSSAIRWRVRRRCEFSMVRRGGRRFESVRGLQKKTCKAGLSSSTESTRRSRVRFRSDSTTIGVRSGRCFCRGRIRFQRTSYRPGALCQFDLWEPSREIPVGAGQTRRGTVAEALFQARAGGDQRRDGVHRYAAECPRATHGAARHHVMADAPASPHHRELLTRLQPSRRGGNRPLDRPPVRVLQQRQGDRRPFGPFRNHRHED
jgi:hypothetical protein